MRQLQRTGMEGDGPIGPGRLPRLAIPLITGDRPAPGSQLNTNLMGPTRLRVHLQQGMALVTAKHAVAEQGVPGLGMFLRHHPGSPHAAADGALRDKVIGKIAGIPGRFTRHQGEVGLRGPAQPPAVGDAGSGLSRAGEKQDPGGGPIDAVDDPEVNISRLGMPCLEEGLGPIGGGHAGGRWR